MVPYYSYRVVPLILMGFMLGLSGYVFQWTNLHGTWGKNRTAGAAFNSVQGNESPVPVQ